MPTRTTVDAFIAHVISGDHVGAIRDWYHEDAWTQENQAPPQQGGREALMKREGAMMDGPLHAVPVAVGKEMHEGVFPFLGSLAEQYASEDGRDNDGEKECA